MGTRILRSLAAIGLAVLVVSPGIFGVAAFTPDWAGAYTLAIEVVEEPDAHARLHADLVLDDGGAARFRVRNFMIVGGTDQETDVELPSRLVVAISGALLVLDFDGPMARTGRWSRVDDHVVVRLLDGEGGASFTRIWWDRDREAAFTTLTELRTITPITQGTQRVWLSPAEPQVDDNPREERAGLPRAVAEAPG